MNMTNEEAILRILEHNMIHQAKEPQAVRITEALNLAIKALKREPCTDAISREEALKEMQNYYDDCAKTSEYTRLGFETAMNVVRKLPPVTPERPKGEWKYTDEVHEIARCSKCRFLKKWKAR